VGSGQQKRLTGEGEYWGEKLVGGGPGGKAKYREERRNQGGGIYKGKLVEGEKPMG